MGELGAFERAAGPALEAERALEAQELGQRLGSEAELAADRDREMPPAPAQLLRERADRDPAVQPPPHPVELDDLGVSSPFGMPSSRRAPSGVR